MPQRTGKQNNSIHKGCQQIADTLVSHGVSLQDALIDLDVPPTMESIKAAYRAIGKSMFGKESTADLTTAEVDQVWKVLTKTLAINTGVDFSFPSYLDMIDYE